MEDISHHFFLSGPRGWVWAGNGCCALCLWDCEVPSRGAGGHLKVRVIFRDSLADTGLLKTLNNSPGCCPQAQILLLPQMAVGRTRVPCPYLTLGSRDGSQTWHFYHCLRATLKRPYFGGSFPAIQMMPSSHSGNSAQQLLPGSVLLWSWELMPQLNNCNEFQAGPWSWCLYIHKAQDTCCLRFQGILES